MNVTLSDSTGIENVIGSATAANTITGNSRDNTLVGGSAADIISGGEGNNLLDGGEGNNTLTAGNGNNTVTAGDGTNNITTGNGDDTISVGNGNNAINAGGGNNIVNTGNGTNTIQPNPGTGIDNVNGQLTDHPPTLTTAGDEPNLVDLNGTGGSQSVTWFVIAGDQDVGDALTLSVVQDTLGVGIVQLDSRDWQVTATVDESDVQQTEECTLRVTDAAGLTADTSLFVSTRDSTNAQNEAPLNWPPFVQDVWFAVPPDGHLTVDNSSLFDPPIEVEDPLPYEWFTGTLPKTFTVITPPAHAQDFTFDTTTGSFTYEPVDGYSGADQFTVQVKDGVNQYTQIGTGNIFTVTVFKPDLDVKTVLHNQENGDLPQAQKVDFGTTVAQGAYLPVYSSDDSYSPAQFIFPNPAAKTTLLPIVLKQFSPAAGGAAGFYSLGIPTNVQVWRTPDKTAAVTSADRFPAGKDTPLWVEGVNPGSGTLGLSWTDGLHSDSDSSKITVFTWQGPRNVPGTSSYTYGATGGYPGPISTWVGGGTGSTLLETHESNPSDPFDVGDTGRFKWTDGPMIGSVSYKPALDYVWDMNVNVVRVEVLPLPGGKVFTINQPTPRDLAGGGTIRPGAIPGNAVSGMTVNALPDTTFDGIQWNADVFLTGPNGGRGVDHITTGFVQTVDAVTLNGVYDDKSTLASDLQNRMPMNDSPSGSSPWYRINNEAKFTGALQSDLFPGMYQGKFFGSTYARLISAGDAPTAGVPWTKDQVALAAGTTPLTSINFLFQFTIEVISVTTDSTIDSNPVYTNMAEARWEFDGSGDYKWPTGPAGAYTWSPTGAGYTAIVDAWSTKHKGAYTPFQHHQNLVIN